MALEMRLEDLDNFGDLQLLINQLLQGYEVKKDIIPYHKQAM